jgi:hypothetical protein
VPRNARDNLSRESASTSHVRYRAARIAQLDLGPGLTLEEIKTRLSESRSAEGHDRASLLDEVQAAFSEEAAEVGSVTSSARPIERERAVRGA